MKKFRVTVREIYSVKVDVEAENEEAAREAASTISDNGCYPDGTDLDAMEHEYTVALSKWPVEEVKEF